MKLISLFIVVLPSLAWSYPAYIGKGYTNCGSCHYSPTGGAMPNSYGYASQSATFPDAIHSQSIQSMRESLRKNDVTGFSENNAKALQWDVGLDARLALLLAEDGNGGSGGTSPKREAIIIPMLLEVGGALAYGPWLAYGSVTPRRSGPNHRPDSIFSREHWLGYKFGDVAMIRVGRMVLPFGIRSPDHTLYTREDFGFDKWGQSYSLEWDYSCERWMISAAGFAGDLLLEPTDHQQRGGVASVAFNFPGKATVGTSFLASKSKYLRTIAGSLFSRAKFLRKFYVMEEVAMQQESSTENLGNTNEFAATFRMGMFPIESLDIYFETSNRRILGKSALNKARYSVGSQWQVLPWVEFIPIVMFEDTETNNEITAMGQFHVVF